MSQIGTYGTISLEQIVSTAKLMLRTETSDDDIFLERLANEGVRNLDSLSIFIKRQCTLQIVDSKAKLPNGFHSLLALRFNNGFNCGNLFYVDLPFLNNCGCTNVNEDGNIRNSTGIFQIQNGYIHFMSGLTFTDPVTEVVTEVTEVECAFIGMNVDENGLMIVREDMERGLVAYLCYMYMLSNSEKYPVGVWQEHKATWIAQKMWLQGNDVQNKFRNTRRQIASIANAYITSKNWWT